jgi:hypothetical protein
MYRALLRGTSARTREKVELRSRREGSCSTGPVETPLAVAIPFRGDQEKGVALAIVWVDGAGCDCERLARPHGWDWSVPAALRRDSAGARARSEGRMGLVGTGQLRRGGCEPAVTPTATATASNLWTGAAEPAAVNGHARGG